MHVKNLYRGFAILLMVNTMTYGVNPAAFIGKRFEKCAVQGEREALARRVFFESVSAQIKKAVGESEMHVLVKMELASDSPGFFEVEKILENPEMCREMVRAGIGSDRYDCLTEKAKASKKEKNNKFLKFTCPVKKKSKKYVDREIQVHLGDDGREITGERKCPVFSSSLLSAEESEGVMSLLRKEMNDAEERIAKAMEGIFLGRSLFDLKRLAHNPQVCRTVVRRGLPESVGIKLLGKEKYKGVFAEEKECVARSMQKDEELPDPQTQAESLTFLIKGACIEERLMMNARKVSRPLALLEVKRGLADFSRGKQIVEAGLGEDGIRCLLKMVGAGASKNQESLV